MVYKSFDKKLALLADKSARGCAIINENMSKTLLENYANQLLENFKKEKFTHLL